MAAAVANGTTRLATLGPINSTLDQIIKNLNAIADRTKSDDGVETISFNCSFDLALHLEADYYIPIPFGGVHKGRAKLTEKLGRKGFSFKFVHRETETGAIPAITDTVAFDTIVMPDEAEYFIEGKKVHPDRLMDLCRDPGGWESSG
ncbi:hypothetical protein GOB02_06390 [Sinorhizobium meliloti]|nr:hypothetical protein [Sinorhizobium meliloti]